MTDKFTRIQDPVDRKDYPSLMRDVSQITGSETGFHPDDFIEKYLNHDLSPKEQQMLHDFYSVNVWWQNYMFEYND